MENKKIVMVIAHKNFRDEEYFIPLQIFEGKGFEVKTASSVVGAVLGVLGGEAQTDLKVSDIDVEGFDAIVFSGGEGAREYFEDEKVHKIIRDFYEKGKVVGAICIAPVILAKAGILRNKKATVWTSNLDRSPEKILEENGCEFSGKDVESDGKIITASGPKAAEEFANRIVQELQ